jgi:cellulose synthase/poly-beta-1,6-N-acetylglucosamine synthase-like glycosyltransferase
MLPTAPDEALTDAAPDAAAFPGAAPPMGRCLVESGAITPADLLAALSAQRELDALLGEILVAEGRTTPDRIDAAMAARHSVARVDLRADPADPDLFRLRPAAFWLQHRILPWRLDEACVHVATAHPDRLDAHAVSLALDFGAIRPVFASDADIEAAISKLGGAELARAAATRVPAPQSCRTFGALPRTTLFCMLALLAAGLGLAPMETLGMLGLLAVLSLLLFVGLRLTATLAHLMDQRHLTAPRPALRAGGRLPRVSVLVPLFREREIAEALLKRLRRIDYPRALLDVILVLEEKDDTTRAALAEASLPRWMRVVEVPAAGPLTTKPRAMNYALDFCRGEIVGVWDAEDAPVPDQIRHAVAHFAGAAPDVACVQGILDYYNPRTNWLSRCFTIEYASWFRVILPGMARMGLVVPLGGTTLFVRRAILEQVGGWDAHNVTEDADLGVRLARAGYRTEMMDTVTFEEANARPLNWVRQRSRWLKGFMVTYLVHMRSPVALWRDLGALRFLGLQAFFLGTLGPFLLAPLLWSCWLLLITDHHPAALFLPPPLLAALIVTFIVAETMGILIGMLAVSSKDRRFLLRWVPTLPLYFPLATLAAYKALAELLAAPFYWDKTPHGQAKPDRAAPVD